MSSDVKWMVGVIVAAIIAIGIAVSAVSVTVLQFNRIATGMRHHEHRTNTSNTQTILALEMLVDRMRDDYRDGMQVVDDVLHELRAVRRRLDDWDESRDQSNAALRRDLERLERAFSNLDEALTVSMLFRPVRTSGVIRHLEEIRDELRALRRHPDRLQRRPASSDPSPPASSDPSPPASDPSPPASDPSPPASDPSPPASDPSPPASPETTR